MHAMRELMCHHYASTMDCIEAAGQVEHLIHTPLECPYNSVFGTLAHIVGVDRLWSLRCREGISLEHLPGEAFFSSLINMKEILARQEEAMLAYLLVIAPKDLQRTIGYVDLAGRQQERPLDVILLHMAQHAAHHRGELTTLLRLLGATHAPRHLLSSYTGPSQQT
ncbi:DinB family protein [Paucidesulfovibrio gracilis DSM 16080]|uniref:DinB family protein n=1 Tax=Paucidesulfovibrio gracilis DSM 16080 TaxID=1121449 RepID=A0A1T4XPI4_9BACT|nr:DinB family protein [Paucidesulfovibrio gracilis]SKA91466.1 DinB family protein [Paucidesulfovibrio gracilis DSM 16080]